MLVNYLNNLNIRNKLIIFLIVPVLTILYFSLSGVHLKVQEHNNVKGSKEFISVFLQFENLVFELQNERGLSAGFVANAGNSHSDKLHQQRKVTDEKISLFLLMLNNNTPNKKYWGAPHLFDSVQLKLQQLPATRTKVDNLKANGFFDAYSEIISSGLSIAQHIPLISNDVVLGRESDAFTTLLLLEELAAKERGLINLVFSSSNLNEKHIKDISTMVSGQEELFKHFYNIALSSQKHQLLEKMKHPSVSKVEKLRTAVLYKAARNDRLNSLLNLIGYGGLIHDFKNYVFRGKQRYLDGFNKKYFVIRGIIKEYQELPGMSDKEISALNTIKLTFHKYKSMLEIADGLREKGKSFSEIDSVVKVNDKPALDAIQYLHKSVTGLDTSKWLDIATTRINLIKEVNDDIRNDIVGKINQHLNATDRTLYIYIILTLASLMFSFVLGYRIIHRVVGGIINIESHMSRMSTQGEFDSLLEVKGNDEISKVAESFNNLISERTKYESQLRLASMVFDKTSEAMVVTDADNKFIAINPSFTKITGYSIEDVKGATPALLQSGKQDKQFYNELWASLRHKGYWSGEIYNRRKNGEIYAEWLNINVIKDSEGKITRHIAMFTDISNRKKMEDEIHSSEQHLKLYREQAPMATIEWDTNFQVIDWNKEAENIFGYSVDEIKGHDFVEIMLPKNATVSVKKVWSDLMSQSGGELSINENLTKDGRTILCEWHNTPLKDEEGNVIGAASIVQDITEREQKEEQFRRSQKMDALGKLTGGIAHDYNNMLGVVLGYAELLNISLTEQPKLVGYVEQIQNAGRRGANLTSKLLSFSSDTSTDTKALNINTILRSEKLMLEKTLTVRINLIFNLEEDLYSVMLDENEFGDILLNMSINAMHAIEGNGNLTIKTRNIKINAKDEYRLNLHQGDYIELSITDTGNGMTNETKEKLFDPFYSTKGDKGTGLGLSQVYGFVKNSGGAIEVASELGKGSQFTLYFPRIEDKNNNNNNQIDASNDIDLRGKETILVVDDESSLLKLCSEILRGNGYNVLCAESATQAMEILKSKPVDVLLSDVIMPEMDGYELASIVQKEYPNVKIQMQSGFTDEHHLKIEDKNLHKNLIYKPYQTNNLLMKIRNLLDD